jgi:hypothetical protein
MLVDTYFQCTQSLAELSLMQTGYFQEQLKQGRHEPGLPEELQIQLSFSLNYFDDFPADELHSFIVSVLYFNLFFQVKCQLHNSLLFSARKVLDHHAFIVVLKTDAVEFLLEFSILDFSLLFFDLLFRGSLFARLMEGGRFEGELGTGLCAGLIVFFEQFCRAEFGNHTLLHDIFHNRI